MGWRPARGVAPAPTQPRLTTPTGDLPDDPNPCLVPPAAGYKGTENQLYRVEIHRGGPQATAPFKWSRDNATVATRVTEIHGGTRLVVESLGRDDVLGFHPGDWIEIVDDWHELHGRPGLLRRIRPGGAASASRISAERNPSNCSMSAMWSRSHVSNGASMAASASRFTS